jgi:predicted PurR-regulated permease PerM
LARSIASRENSRLLAVVVTVVAIAALYLAKIVLLPLALAILFSFLLAPLVTQLERVRLPRVLAILLVMLAFGAGVGAIGWIVVGQLIQVTNHLADYRENIADKVAVVHHTQETSFSRARHEVEQLGKQLGISAPETTRDRRRRSSKSLGASPERPVSVQEVSPTKASLASLHGIFDPLASLLLVTVFTFFVLLQREDLRNRLIRLTGHGHLSVMTQTMDEASRRVSRYFSLQLLVNICYGSIIFTALHFIGLPHALLWGALAGILRFIPYIGAPIAALLPTLLSLAVFNGWTQTLTIMAVFFVMEVLTANFIEPHLYGKQTGLSSLAILVAAVFWTLVWGPIGLILSVPLTVCLVVVGAHVPSLQFLTVLLGDQPVMPPPAHYYQRLLASDEHEAGQVLERYLKDKPLEDLYDSVLIPALSLSEQDRHRNTLDDATVNFINQTTRELVEEIEIGRDRNGDYAQTAAETGADSLPPNGQPSARSPVTPLEIVCIPVRDDADEIAAVMLAQLLERAGHHAQAVSVQNIEGMLAEAARAKPDLVCLSALPPYAMSPARGVYRKLRAREPELRIIIGLWNYTGDPAKGAREISGGEQDQLSTTLAQAVSQATSPVGRSTPEDRPNEDGAPDVPMVRV